MQSSLRLSRTAAATNLRASLSSTRHSEKKRTIRSWVGLRAFLEERSWYRSLHSSVIVSKSGMCPGIVEERLPMRRLFALVVLFLVSCTGYLRAQSTNASVTGYITDPTKAVIVDAKVVLINVGTRIRHEGTTDKSGSYDISDLPPGPYRIEVEKPGFKTVVKSDVILHVQDTIAINFEMVLGSASEIVTVEAGAPLVNTESSAVSTVIDRQFVGDLPLNG